MAAINPLTWRVYVDWDRDGSYATAGDEITSDVLRTQWKIGMRQAFQLTADESELTLTLDNTTKKYSPEYASGALYGKIEPQRPVKIEAVYAGGTATMFVGWIDTVEPAWGNKGAQVSVLNVKGAKQHLQRANIFLELMQNVTADEVLEVIFGQVTFPPNIGNVWLLGQTGSTELGVTTYLVDIEEDVYDFEAGATTFAYVGDNWNNDTDAYSAIARLMRSERGRFYFNRAGKAIFLNHQNFQAHYLNDGTVNNKMGGAEYEYGGDIYNDVRVSYSPRSITPGTVTLWSMDTPVRVGAGESKVIRARFSDDSGAQIAGYNVGTPSISADSGITLDSFTAAALSAEATFLNSGSLPGSVTAMDITGQKLTSWNKAEIAETNQQSMTTYGDRWLSLDCDLIDNENDARSIAQYELLRRQTPRGTMHSITLQQRDATNSQMMYQRTIGDRIRVVEPKTAHDKDYFIIGEEWTLGQGFKSATVKWNLEPASTYTASFLDVTGTNALNSTARLGF